MIFLCQQISWWCLTITKNELMCFLLQLNNPARGKITLTLVIARNYPINANVLVSMFNFFKIKSKLEVQLEEYIKFKAKYSPFIARDQEAVLKIFIKEMGHLTLTEITPEQIEEYYISAKTKMTKFNASQAMKAVRAFIRFNKHDTEIIADKITDNGIISLQSVERKLIPPPEIKPKLGRTMNIELVKKVKRLRDNEHLSYRAIGKAIGKDVSHVYLMYKYDISCLNVVKRKK